MQAGGGALNPACVNDRRSKTYGHALSRREREVLFFLAQDASNPIIARHFGVSPETVKMHLRRVFRKLGVHNRAGAVLTALAHGVLSLDLDAATGAVEMSLRYTAPCYPFHIHPNGENKGGTQ